MCFQGPAVPLVKVRIVWAAASDRGNYKRVERVCGSYSAIILHSGEHSVCAPVRAAPAEVHSATLALCHICSFEDVRISCHLGDCYFIKCFKHAFFAFFILHFELMLNTHVYFNLVFWLLRLQDNSCLYQASFVQSF